MKRDLTLFLNDINDSIKNIEFFSQNLLKEEFMKSRLNQSAIVRELEIIGEAVKNIPEEFRNKYPEIKWNNIAGFRDIIIHSYFKVDLEKVWNVIKKDLPDLKKKMERIRGNLG